MMLTEDSEGFKLVPKRKDSFVIHGMPSKN